MQRTAFRDKNSRRGNFPRRLFCRKPTLKVLFFIRLVFVRARFFVGILLILSEKRGVVVVRIFLCKVRNGNARGNKLFYHKHFLLVYIFFQTYAEVFLKFMREPRFAYETLLGYYFRVERFGNVRVYVFQDFVDSVVGKSHGFFRGGGVFHVVQYLY